MISRIRRSVYGGYALFVFAAVTLSTTAVIAILPGLQRRRRVARLAARTIFFCSGVSITVRDQDLLGHEPVVVVANHASYLDGIILTAVLPPRFSFVIKREITRLPVAHLLLRRLGSQFVDRFDSGRSTVDARRIMRHAHSGEALAVFPEGTFSADPGLRRFRTGAFAAAVRGGLPVVPAVISGSRQMLSAGSRLPARGALDVRFFEPIPAQGTGREALEHLKNASREAILSGLDEPDLSRAADPPTPGGPERMAGER